ncbi:MAG: peptidase C15 [Cyanobacteria bacterium P01_D01_bin.105]
MNTPILITSFQPWRVHQRSNSSDDLVAEMQKKGLLPSGTVWLRQVPVSFDLAPVRVESEIMRLRPRVVICCGMAEKRWRLSVERQAKRYLQRQTPHTEGFAAAQISVLQTTVDVDRLVTGTCLSKVSEDAGSYVCNHLYYSVLKLVGSVDWEITGIFIHVPILHPDNKTFLVEDFSKILARLVNRDC